MDIYLDENLFGNVTEFSFRYLMPQQGFSSFVRSSLGPVVSDLPPSFDNENDGENMNKRTGKTKHLLP